MMLKIVLSFVFILVGLTFVILFSSCRLFTISDYRVGFRNISGHEINVFFTSKIGNYAPPVGILIVSENVLLPQAVSLSHSGIPESVTIKWRKDNGKIIVRKVKVKENMPKGFGNLDTIVFNINSKDEVFLSFRMKNSKYNEIDSKGNEMNFKNYGKR